MSSPKVSVIIVNYNGKELLKKCLESLFKVNYKNFEVILVENNSTDGTVEFITKNYPSIIIIKLDSNKGFAEPNNIGSKIANGEYLLFLNNDTVVTPDFISKMIKVTENDNKIGICQSLLLKPDGSIDSSGDFIDKLGIVYNSKTKTDEIREIFSARGASMLIRKKIFEKLERFDEKFYVSFEDVDLGWRTWIMGYRVVLVPSSIVYHKSGSTVESLKPIIAFHGFKNQISMKITNFESKLILQKLVSFFFKYGIRELKIWFDYAFHGTTTISPTDYEDSIAQKPSFKIIIRSLFWVITNSHYLIHKHNSVNSTRTCSTKQLEEIKIISNFKQ